MALIIGGIWAGYKFRKFRSTKPKLNIQHTLKLVKRTNYGCIFRINLTLANVGNIKIDIESGRIDLNNLDKVEKEYLKPSQWANKNIHIKTIEFSDFHYVPVHLEPGETETAYTLVHLDTCPTKIELYSNIENNETKPSNKSFGWNNSTIIDNSTMSKKIDKRTNESSKPDETRQGYGRDRQGDKPLPNNQGEGRRNPNKDKQSDEG